MKRFLLYLTFLLPIILVAQPVKVGTVASSKSNAVAASWTESRTFTVAVSDYLQFVEVDKDANMKADYSDLRFCIDPTGTTAEKLFLEYWIQTSDGSSANIWVAFPKANSPPPEVASTFTVVWGNPDAEEKSSGYQAFDAAGYFFNDFSRGIDYDVVNVLGGYDQLLAGDTNGEETWPAGWQDPDDVLHCGVIYKRQDSNLHAGNPTTRTGMRTTTDGWQTFSGETVIDNPGETYHTTSSTSVAIPTTHPSERTFTVGAGLPWQTGDLGQARGSDTQYFDFTVVSYSGTTLVVNSNNHIGTGTLTTWVISDRIGATNATITAVKMPNNVVRLIMLNSHVDYTITTGTSRVGTKYSDDWGVTWSAWVERGPTGEWANVGGQAITMNNGYCLFSAHQNILIESRPDATDLVFLTRDYGVTWVVYELTTGIAYLDEMGMFQMKNTTTWAWDEERVKLIMRNEQTPFHYYTTTLTIDESSISNSAIVENNFYVDEVSRGTYTWADKRIIGGFGDVRGQYVFSDDSGETWNPVPFTTIEGNIYSSRRLYEIFYYFGNGKTACIWTNNLLSGGADLYISYWDSKLMALRAISSTTLSDSRTRPFDLDPGLRINGSLVNGYRTTSTTSIAVPTSHPTERTLTVSAGLSWQAGETGVCTYRLNGAVRFEFTVVSYSGTTLVVNSSNNTGTGTQANWSIDKLSNLLANQAFVSYWNRNGSIEPFIFRLSVNAPNGGFFGLKKDETRATAVVTITNAGAAGDVITISWSSTSAYGGLFTGIGKVATYTVQSGDAIADVVAGLVSSANLIGICPVSTSDGTTLTLRAPRGESTFINTRALTISATGTVAGSSGNFASGAVPEDPTTLSNVIVIDKANDVVRIEQANDNHSQAMSNTDDVSHDYVITFDNPTVVTDGTTTRTKTAATGSGIPNWPAQIVMFVTTAVASPWVYLESTMMRTEPVDDVTATPGSDDTGNFQLNAMGNGFL